MAQTDEAEKPVTLEELDEALRMAAMAHIADDEPDAMAGYVQALVAVRGMVRADTEAACRNAESGARAAAHRASVAATERKGGGSRG